MPFIICKTSPQCTVHCNPNNSVVSKHFNVIQKVLKPCYGLPYVINYLIKTISLNVTFIH